MQNDFPMKMRLTSLLLLLVLWVSCCSSDERISPLNETTDEQETTEGLASVTGVSVSGQENQYTFNVTISSPDLGCQQYADWWEIIDLDGNLVYRRILAHSHVNEQPFSRGGGPVQISEDTEVYVRAHMNTTGYGTTVFRGTVKSGFMSVTLDVEFAEGLVAIEPLPTGCAF